MPIYQRESGIWYIDIVTQSGKRIRRSAKTKDKTAAQALHDKISYEQWRVDKMEVKPKVLWDQAALRWIRERSNKKSINDDISKLRLLSQFRNIYLSDITQDFIMNIVDEMDCSDSTKNRYLALIRSILNRSVKIWHYIDHAPTVIMYSESNSRIRWLRPEEAHKLIDCLKPSYLADMALFTLNTGLRLNNVLNLKKEQIDLDRKVAWYYGDETKSGEALGVALNEIAFKLIKQNWRRHPQYIFVNSLGHRIAQIDRRTWATALEKAGIQNFRWHDLRHTWASWLAQSGVPLRTLQEMGGWKSVEMVQRYAHLSPEHLHEHAKVLASVTDWDTNLTQS